ncbi:MAG: bifunctional phosphoribosyl-AMP cyclohydrolase/phosphoribosyl-ATP diphosphatase HisIE [Bacillota bacterium]
MDRTDVAAVTEVRFGPDGLVPVVVQSAVSGEVLMLAFANREALVRTLGEGKAWYFSRSRGRLWCKGETSGNFQEVVEVRCDCDGDALLYRVNPGGPSCHTGHHSCFYRTLCPAPGAPGQEARVAQGDMVRAEQSGPAPNWTGAGILAELAALLRERRRERPAGSYSAALFSAGRARIAQKVGEEAVEVVVASMGGDRERMVAEVADLLFHVLVLLADAGIDLAEIWAELGRRHVSASSSATRQGSGLLTIRHRRPPFRRARALCRRHPEPAR